MRQLCLILALALAGATLSAAPPADDLELAQLKREMLALKEELSRIIRQQRLADQEALRARQEMFDKQAAELQAYAEAIRQQNRNIQTLLDRMTALEAENRKLKETLASMPARWQREIAAETQARQAADRQLGEQLAAEVAKAVNPVASRVDQQAERLRQLDTQVNPPPPPAPTAADVYTVQKGDTLSMIAKAFGVRVADIKTLNKLEGDTIFVGQKLKIPEAQ